MKRTFKKTVTFCLAIAIFIGIISPSIAANATEKSENGDYILKVISENEYSDGVRFGDGYLMLQNGKINDITSKTTYTIIDANGNKKELKNTVGFTEIYLNTSGNSYYVDYGVLAVGKNNKVALIDENGYLYGGNENFYSCVVYAGDELFYTTNATANLEDKGNTTIWTLRKKDGTIIKEFTKLNLSNRAHANGYEYIMYEEDGVNKLISVDKNGKIRDMETGYSSFITSDKNSLHYRGDYDGEYVVAYKTDPKTYTTNLITVFNVDGSKLFNIENATYIDLAGLSKYGYAKVQLYNFKDGDYEYCENIVDLKGNFMLDSWKYDFVKSYDDKRALTFNDEGETLLVDYSKNIKFDAQKFAKEFGESYSAITFSSYYIDSTLTVTIEDEKSNSDIGTTFFFDSEGKKISGDIKGQVLDFDGTYAILYDKIAEKNGVISKNGDILKKGYDEVYLEKSIGNSDVVARGKYHGSDKPILLLKDKSEIDKYGFVDRFINGHAIVTDEKGEKKGIIDTKGNEIVKVGTYSDFKQFTDSECFIGYKGGYTYLFDTTGKVLTDEKAYKEIGDYISKFYEFSTGRNRNEYENAIGKNNVAITVNNENKFGLIKVQKHNPVTSVSIDKSKITLVKGKMEKLKAIVNPSDADNKSVLWESSNKNIITVDSSGNVKAISPGKATVTVKTVDGGKVAKCEVTVTNPITQGWIEEGGKKYYYNNGVKYTGLQYVDGSRYYFGTDGAMRTGWQDIGSYRYYFKENGQAAKNEWIESSGKKYYINVNGVMLKGIQNINGQKYYLGTDGVMRTGWQNIGQYRYYFRLNGQAVRNEWFTQNGKTYRLNENGVMLKSMQIINGQKYYLGSDGVRRTGWQSIGGNRYYFKADGKAIRNEWFVESGKIYRLNENGVMLKNWQNIGGKKYYLGADGVRKVGKQTINGKVYNFDKNGVLK